MLRGFKTFASFLDLSFEGKNLPYKDFQFCKLIFLVLDLSITNRLIFSFIRLTDISISPAANSNILVLLLLVVRYRSEKLISRRASNQCRFAFGAGCELHCRGFSISVIDRTCWRRVATRLQLDLQHFQVNSRDILPTCNSRLLGSPAYSYKCMCAIVCVCVCLCLECAIVFKCGLVRSDKFAQCHTTGYSHFYGFPA